MLSEINCQLCSFCSKGLFQVNATTGAVTVAAPLNQRPGIYNITVGVRDSGSPEQRHTTAVVHITVLEGNNAAPTWVFPNATYGTVRVLEVSPVLFIAGRSIT